MSVLSHGTVKIFGRGGEIQRLNYSEKFRQGGNIIGTFSVRNSRFFCVSLRCSDNFFVPITASFYTLFGVLVLPEKTNL
jgi:hypothetical protein